jgi:hypothetical protein
MLLFFRPDRPARPFIFRGLARAIPAGGSSHKETDMDKVKTGVVATLLAATLGGCGGGASDSKLNEAVKTVLVVGTSVTGQIYVDGGYGITLVPLD